MNADWRFVSNGILISSGPKKLAKNGIIGVTSELELCLYNDNGEIIDRAPVSQAVVKFSTMLGDSVKMNGRKYGFSFVPPPKTSALLLGGAIGALAAGIASGAENANNAERRKEFKELIESLNPNPA